MLSPILELSAHTVLYKSETKFISYIIYSLIHVDAFLVVKLEMELRIVLIFQLDLIARLNHCLPLPNFCYHFALLGTNYVARFFLTLTIFVISYLFDFGYICFLHLTDNDATVCI